MLNIKEIEENIEYYSKDRPFPSYARNLSAGLTEEEKEIVINVSEKVKTACVKYLKGEINDSEISQIANSVMFGEHDPGFWYRILDEKFYNFLMDLGEIYV